MNNHHKFAFKSKTSTVLTLYLHILIEIHKVGIQLANFYEYYQDE